MSEADLMLPSSWQRHPLGQQGVVHELRFTWTYVAGMVDSDGCVSASMQGNSIHAKVIVCQSNQAFLTSLSQWLLRHNIFASVYARKTDTPYGEYSCGEGRHVLSVRTHLSHEKDQNECHNASLMSVDLAHCTADCNPGRDSHLQAFFTKTYLDVPLLHEKPRLLGSHIWLLLLQVLSESLAACCEILSQHTVQKNRQCRALASAWPQRGFMDTAQRQNLVSIIQKANQDPASAEHLVLSNITDGWLAGMPSPECLEQVNMCSGCPM